MGHPTPERDLPAGRSAARREQLMAEITAPGRAARRPRKVGRRGLVGALVCGGLLVGAPVAANELGYFRHSDGTVGVTEDSLDVVYQGQRLSRADIARLQAEGKALVVVSDAESAKSGVAHAFDSESEAAAWRASTR